MTELTTGLGMLGFESIEEALSLQPAEMVSVAPETWSLLRRAYEGGALAAEFASSWANGRAFLESNDGLRNRRPLIIEWKGSHRAPGDEVAPIDLRIDHVFLVSCKYLSKIMINASPARLFERLLEGGHGMRDPDWYERMAAHSYQALYEVVRQQLGLFSLPSFVGELRAQDRRQLSLALAAGWPDGVNAVHEEFVAAVALATARLWNQQASSPQKKESLLWRMLRMGSAPYYVLGSTLALPLRIRVATPWDWRLDFRLKTLEVDSQAGGQPRVKWKAVIEERNSRRRYEVLGHVEIRWSHGRFSGHPEAKVYLDTAHAEVPGYYQLV